MADSLFDFDAVADEYDAFYEEPFGQEVDRVEKELIAPLLGRLERRQVLEVGCGTGHWTAFLREHGFIVTAIDVSEAMLRVARAKAIPGADVLRMDARALAFEDGAVDNVAAFTALEFVPGLEAALAEIRRVLRPGGFFLVGALNEQSYLGRHKADDEVFRDAHFFTPETLREALRSFGGEPEIHGCVVLREGEIVDATAPVSRERRLAEGAFLVGLVRTPHTS